MTTLDSGHPIELIGGPACGMVLIWSKKGGTILVKPSNDRPSELYVINPNGRKAQWKPRK